MEPSKVCYQHKSRCITVIIVSVYPRPGTNLAMWQRPRIEFVVLSPDLMGTSATPFPNLAVLVVEDESLVWLALEDVLLELGCRPARAVDVPSALSIVGSQRPDLAILDVNICGETSYPVAERLVQLGVPIIFLTGSDRSAMPERWRVWPFVAKPFSQEMVQDALAEALDRP
jgi:CheY-like chemotaxis protein